jgi:threonine synthase
MNNVIGFECVECARRFGADENRFTCDCGGNLDVLYDYDRVGKRLSRDSLGADRNFVMWRYLPLLPVSENSVVPPLVVGWTPVYDCPQIALRYNIGQLLIKDEGRNPTGSLKDRPSAIAVVKAMEAGANIITTASSGNAGSALAGMCASVGMESVIFVPSNAPAAKVAQLQIYGSRVILVEAPYDDVFDLCVEAARRYGWYQRSTGINPFMTEGKKTAAFEVAEQCQWQVPDKVFVSVGDGSIIGGLWKGFNDFYRLRLIDRLPQLIGVQAEGASPIADAVDGDGRVKEVAPRTIADSISVGRPRDAVKAIRAMRESNGRGVKVSDEEILTAIGELARATGVFVEPAAAAAFAGFKKLSEGGAVGSDERVLLLLTGNGLKDVDAVRRTVGEPAQIRLDIEELARIL